MNSVTINKIYDLSQPLFHNCPGWVEYPSTHVTRDYHIPVNGFNAEMMHMNTHTGTHLDVPFHFYENGDTIEKVPLESFMGPGLFCDLRHKEPDTPITAEDLAPFLPLIERGDWVILNTGMGKKRGFNKEYLMGWAYLDGSGAEGRIKAGIKGVGIDALSIGGWGSPTKGRPCHEVLLSGNAYILEDLLIPDEIMDGKKRMISCFPLLMPGCGGAPARAVAYEFA